MAVAMSLFCYCKVAFLPLAFNMYIRQTSEHLAADMLMMHCTAVMPSITDVALLHGWWFVQDYTSVHAG